MSEQREQLIALIDDYTDDLSARDLHKADFAERFADRILADGWQKAPCKIGDTVYTVSDFGDIRTNEVEVISYDEDGCYLLFLDSGAVRINEAYFSREAAEEERSRILNGGNKK